jgi:methylmalonyl-CoA mutase N-terminal domain/subunit
MKSRLTRLRQERDNEKVIESLAAIEQAARGKDNLFPFVLSAVKIM